MIAKNGTEEFFMLSFALFFANYCNGFLPNMKEIIIIGERMTLRGCFSRES